MRLAAPLVLAAAGAAAPVFFNNLAPRLDNTGAIIDGHDSSIRKYGPSGPYYMHTVAYGLCQEPPRYGCDQTSVHCGFQPNHTVNVWRSANLSSGSWEFVATAIQPSQRPAGTLFRPDAILNPNTGKTVLWWNYVHPNGTYAGYAAATAPGPAGPFTLQRDVTNVTRNNATFHGGDFHLFSDDDGTGYIIYSSNHVMAVEKLMPNYLDSTGEVYVFPEYFVEAPSLFKRGNTYYALFSWCCCYCYQGSGIIVHTAPHPLGPWTAQGPDIACVASTDGEGEGAAEGQQAASRVTAAAAAAGVTGITSHSRFLRALGHGSGRLASAEGTPSSTPGQGCQYNSSGTTSATRAQQNFVIKVDTPNGPEFVWTGDRWEQSPDGLKGHDPQFWAPLVFDTTSGAIAPMRWIDNFTVDVV